MKTEQLFKVVLKENNEILSTGLTAYMLEYLFIGKKWDKTKCDIISL